MRLEETPRNRATSPLIAECTAFRGFSLRSPEWLRETACPRAAAAPTDEYCISHSTRTPVAEHGPACYSASSDTTPAGGRSPGCRRGTPRSFRAGTPRRLAPRLRRPGAPRAPRGQGNLQKGLIHPYLSAKQQDTRRSREWKTHSHGIAAGGGGQYRCEMRIRRAEWHL